MVVTETQLKTINTALEEYFRLPLNQWTDLADRLARKGVDFDKANPNHSHIFDDYILRRDAVLEVLKTVGRILWQGRIPQKDEEQLIAEDIWQTIRHEKWIADGKPEGRWLDEQPALHLSNEPLPTIKECIREPGKWITTEEMEVKYGER